jgi:YidC/Oxa1 family membrane protein insertase
MTYFFDLLAKVLAAFYEVYPSYGFAIIALTLCVMVILTPLTLKGTRSMMMMQQLQPELKKLQSKYKDDVQKRNEEMMKFYKENNINPVGGCLPLLVQMPVFLVLYNVLRGLTQRIPSMGSSVGWVTGQSGSGSSLSKPPIIHNFFRPDHLAPDSKMFVDLSAHNTMPFADFFHFDLSESASEALGRGFAHAIPFLLLIVVVGITGFVQQRQIQGRMGQQADISDQQRQQQQIMKIMPIFLPVISFGLPSGLVVYFAVSNLYRVAQQAFISRSIYGIKKGESAGGVAPAGKAGPGNRGPGTKGTGPKSPGAKSGGSAKDAPDDGDADDEPKARTRTTAKAGTKTATKTATKTPAKTVPRKSPAAAPAAKAARTGTSRTTPSKAATAAQAEKSASSRSKPGAAKPAARNTTDRPPTLQPRARKTKKR